MPLRVLLVDDHELMRAGLRAILQRERDVEVVGEAEDGRSALELVPALEPDVVVMDVGMRGLDGIEATRQLRASFPNVEILALSIHSDPSNVASMIEAGAAGYVLKRASYDELLCAMRTVAQGETYLSESVAALALPGAPGSGSGLLSAREREIVRLIAEGQSSRQIAEQLHISPHTVETHRRNILRKLGVHGVAELTLYALREGMLSLDP